MAGLACARGTSGTGQGTFSPCGQTEALGKRGLATASGSFMVGGAADIGAKILVGEDATSVNAFGLTSIFTGSIWSDSRQSRYMKWSRLERMGCLVRILACVRARPRGTSGSCASEMAGRSSITPKPKRRNADPRNSTQLIKRSKPANTARSTAGYFSGQTHGEACVLVVLSEPFRSVVPRSLLGAPFVGV